MKYFILSLLVVLACASSANAGIFGRRANVSVNVNRGNARVEKVVVRDNVRVEKVVVNNRHNNNIRVERIVVDNHNHHAQFQNVVVEKVVVDKYGRSQRVRVVERVRVR